MTPGGTRRHQEVPGGYRRVTIPIVGLPIPAVTDGYILVVMAQKCGAIFFSPPSSEKSWSWLTSQLYMRGFCPCKVWHLCFLLPQLLEWGNLKEVRLTKASWTKWSRRDKLTLVWWNRPCLHSCNHFSSVYVEAGGGKDGANEGGRRRRKERERQGRCLMFSVLLGRAS